MSLRAVYTTVSLLALLAEISLLVVLVVRRQYKYFPIFTLSVAYNSLSDIGIGILMVAAPHHIVRSIAFGLLPPQYLLDLGVLLELSWNVLRPVYSSLPRAAIALFASAMGLAVLAGVLLANHLGNTGDKIQDVKTPFDLMVGLLRMLIFAATAGFSQLLGIGWKNKVLQLATGLSFYSAVDLIVSLLARYSGDSSALEATRVVAWALELTFFLYVFTTKEVRRREFSPQMEQFLVTLAGRARDARTALVRMQVK
jgi:hypothetical protein